MPVIRRNPWPGAVNRALLTLLAALLVGWWTGHLLAVVFLVVVAFLGWHLRQTYRLERWLRRERKMEPPRAAGLWGEVFDSLYRMQRRHRARRQQLRDMLRRYRESTRAMPDATVILHGDYEIEWANDAAERLLGLDWPKDEGQRIGNICRHPRFAEFLSARERRTRIARLPSPVSERRILEVRLIPYGYSQYLLLARDITHVQRLERMRRDFVANVSHELRTPLTVIHGVAETLEDQIIDEDQARKSLRLLQQQSERMRRLVDDLLTLSRLETGEAPEDADWLDVKAMLKQLVDDARVVSGERGHRIELECEGRPALFGSGNELRSAFSNLVFNAVKYSPDGSRIRLLWRPDEQGAAFSVKDEGIGIPEKHLTRLTERFYRVDDSRASDTGGTGLGLAIVKHVLTRNGGQLEVSSRYGHGSIFTCRFPASLVRREIA